jgi:hypothetical protein
MGTNQEPQLKGVDYNSTPTLIHPEDKPSELTSFRGKTKVSFLAIASATILVTDSLIG